MSSSPTTRAAQPGAQGVVPVAGLAAAVRNGEVSPAEEAVLLHRGGVPGPFGNAEAVRREEHLLGR